MSKKLFQCAFSRALAVCGLLLFFVSAAHAQWTYRVATDPYIRTISVFKDNPSLGTNTLFVSTLTDGMYKVVDTNNQATTTWTKINNGLPIVEIRTHFTIDINNLYAGTDGAGIFKTTDGGGTWTAINGAGLTALGCMNVRTINTDGVSPRTLTVGTSCRNNSGFYKSTDDGVTWNKLNDVSLPNDVAVSGLTRDLVTFTYYVATSNYGIYKSTGTSLANVGITWTAANTGISVPSTGSFSAFNVQFNGAAPNNLLTYVHGSGVYSSVNGGSNWALSEAGLPAGYAALGGIQKESNTVLYIGLDKQGMYKSINGGASWAAWGNTIGNQSTQFARGLGIVTAGTSYYFATLDGVRKTTDNAATINGVNFSGGGGRINAITHDRDTPYKAYVTGPTLFQLGYIYGDCSIGCSQLDTGVTGNTIEGVPYQDQLNPANIYVTTSNRGIFKSTNGGALFSAINTGLPSMIGQSSRLAIDGNNSLILYLGLSDAAGMFKSIDGGANWTASNTGLTTADAKSINTVTLDQNDSTIVYAATRAGLYKSIDSGATWTLKYSALDSGGSLLSVNAIRVRTGNSFELYMANNHPNANGTLAMSSGVFKSTDGGTNWINILPNQAASQVRVLNNGDIYAGISATTGNPAVWLSTNGGMSFTPYSGGLNGSDIRTFGVAADRSAVLSLSLENGLYTHNTGGPPPSVALSAAITEAPGIFGRVFLGYQTVGTTSPSKAVTITNTSASTATIIGLGADNNDTFSVVHNCPLLLVAGASCTANITFTPNFTGTTSGTLLAAGPVTGVGVALFGVGIGNGQSALLVANDPGMVPAYPTFYNQQNLREITFGNQAVGTSRTISLTMQNAGTVAATFGLSGFSAPMSASSTCGGTIPAGGSCTLNVTYLPTSTGGTSQTLNINHNSPFPIQNPSYPFLLSGSAENSASDGNLVPSFGATAPVGGAGRAFVSFGPYGVESVDRVALQSDGKIIVLMTARKAVEDGIAVAGVARLNADGTLDTTWGSVGYVRLTSTVANGVVIGSSGLHVLPGGKVIVAFASDAGAANPDMVIFRLLSNGQVDTSFGTSGSTVVASLSIQHLEIYADGRMLATGNADLVNNNKLGLVRLNADGTLDASFGTAGRVEQLVPDTMQFGQGRIRTRFAADEKIYVAYPFGVGSARDIALYKLTASGAIDTGWGTAGRINVAPTNLEDNVRNMRVQSDGKILLLSRSERTAGSGATNNYLWTLARLNGDGSPDTLFGTAGVVTTSIGPSNNLATSLWVTADGKILVAGRRNCGGGCQTGQDGVIVRYNRDGSVDTTVGAAGIVFVVITANFESINDFAIDSDGTIVAGGQVSQFDADRGDGTTGSNVDNGFVVKVKNTIGPALVNLTVAVTGSGSVTSSPAGINCGNVCVASFAPATMVTLTAVPSGGSVFSGWSGGGCGMTSPCTLTVATATTVTATFTGGPVALVAVKSRKIHGNGVGQQDLDIARGVNITGAVTVEARTVSAGHLIVFQFDGPITAPGTPAAIDANSVSYGMPSVSFLNNEVLVTPVGITDNKRATISLTGVNGTINVGVTIGFLIGDISSTRAVNAADISYIKAQNGKPVTSTNFRADINLNGTVNATDISAAKARSGVVLP